MNNSVLTREPRIVHLIPQDAFGGIETAARSAAEADRLGCALTLMILAGDTVAKRRCRIIEHPAQELNSPWTYVTAIRELLNLHPDVLICSLWRCVLVGIVVKLLRPSTGLVFFLHNTIPVHLVDRIVDAIGMRVADELWADSRATLNVRPITSAKPCRLISFVTERLTPVKSPELAPRFVSWSRLHRQKGHDRAIRIVAALVSRHIDARLEIWGPDNGEGATLSALASSLGVSDRVNFAGLIDRSRLPEVAAENAFYLQLSRYEGMAMAVVEAMQLALVPIIAPVGEMRAYVRDGANGLVIDPEDTDAAAERISDLLDLPAAFQQMSESAAKTWQDAPLYADDLCKMSLELADSMSRRRRPQAVQ